jgi:hypothetical protein
LVENQTDATIRQGEPGLFSIVTLTSSFAGTTSVFSQRSLGGSSSPQFPSQVRCQTLST